MKHSIYVLLVLTTFVFTACEKEASQVQSEQFTPEEQFDRMQKPLILFQFAQRQLETGVENGWIIDKEGWVKPYQRTFTPNLAPSIEDEATREVELVALYDSASEGLFQIGKAELFDHLKQSIGLHQNQLGEASFRPEEQMVSALFAYVQKTTQVALGEMEGGCSAGETGFVTNTRTNRSIIDMKGAQNRSNTSARGQAIHEWMLDLHSNIQLPELDQ